jgi:hypothetical protein
VLHTPKTAFVAEQQPSQFGIGAAMEQRFSMTNE